MAGIDTLGWSGSGRAGARARPCGGADRRTLRVVAARSQRACGASRRPPRPGAPPRSAAAGGPSPASPPTSGCRPAQRTARDGPCVTLAAAAARVATLLSRA
eukprot:3893783-Prymnesium_polylepis.1